MQRRTRTPVEKKNANPSHRIDADVLQRLKGFLDWLLDYNAWPVSDKGRGVKETRETLRLVQMAAASVENILRTRRVSHDLQAAGHSLHKEEEALKSELESKTKVTRKGRRIPAVYVYRSAQATIQAPRHLGNVELQQRLYVAYLILRKFPQLGASSPHKGAYQNLASYMQEKAYKTDIYDSARKAVSRFRRKIDWRPVDIVATMYSLYLWRSQPVIPPGPGAAAEALARAKRACEISHEERDMLERLVTPSSC